MLVDGHAVVHRAFHAFSDLTTSQGELVNAVYGFTAMLLNALQSTHPAYAAVAFDLPTPTFRHQQFAGYKAQRPSMPPELAGQFQRVRQIVSALHIPIFEVPGFEADDVLGTLARHAAENDLYTLIVTGDLDALQLVEPRVAVLTPRRGPLDTTLYDEAAVLQRYGLHPLQIPDYKGLVGDTSDNIPGVRGIGEKTARTLLAKYETIEGVYNNLDALPPRQRDLLAPFQEQALASKHLATIIRNVPLSLNLEECRVRDDNLDAALDLFRELEFRSLIPRLLPDRAAPLASQAEQITTPVAAPPRSTPAPSSPNQPALFADTQPGDDVPSAPSVVGLLAQQTRGGALLDVQPSPDLSSAVATLDTSSPSTSTADAELPPPAVFIIDTPAALDDLLERLRRRDNWAIDLETTSIQEIGADIVGISFALEPGLAYYLPLGHAEGRQLDRAATLEQLRPILESPAIHKTAHNGKYDMLVLAAASGIIMRGLTFDTMIAAYLLNPGQRGYGLKDQAFFRFRAVMTEIKELIGRGRNQVTMAEVPLADAARYAGADADMTLRLRDAFAPELAEKGLLDLFEHVEMPLVEVLAAMELAGDRPGHSFPEGYVGSLTTPV